MATKSFQACSSAPLSSLTVLMADILAPAPPMTCLTVLFGRAPRRMWSTRNLRKRCRKATSLAKLARILNLRILAV